MVTALTGCPPTCAHAREDAVVAARAAARNIGGIAKFVTPAGYVAGRLAGLQADDAFIDHTFLHFTGVADAKDGRWSDAALRQARDRPRPAAAGSSRRGRSSARRRRRPRATSASRPACPSSPAPATLRRARSARASSGRACCSTWPARRPCLPAAPTASSRTSTNRTLLVMRSDRPGPLASPRLYRRRRPGASMVPRPVRRAATDECAAGDMSYDALVEEALEVAPGAEGLFFSPHLGGRICPADPSAARSMARLLLGPHAARISSARFSKALPSSMPPISRSSKAWCPGLSASRRAWLAAARGARAGTRSRPTFSACPTGAWPRADIATWGSALVAGHAVGLIPDLAEAAARASEPLSAR